MNLFVWESLNSIDAKVGLQFAYGSLDPWQGRQLIGV